MKSPAGEYVTLVEVLELTRPFEEFEAAIKAAARRLQTEGIEELVTLQFYAEAGIHPGWCDPHLRRPQPRHGAYSHDHRVGGVRQVLGHCKAA